MSVFEKVNPCRGNRKYRWEVLQHALCFLLEPIAFPTMEMKDAVLWHMGLRDLDEGSKVKYDRQVCEELELRRCARIQSILESGCCDIPATKATMGLVNAIDSIPPYLDDNGTLVTWYLAVSKKAEESKFQNHDMRWYVEGIIFAPFVDNPANHRILLEILSQFESPFDTAPDGLRYLDDPDFARRYVNTLYRAFAAPDIVGTSKEDVLDIVNSAINSGGVHL